MSLQLMEVLEINHINKFGDTLFQKKNIKNLVHKQGETYMLKVLFGDLSKAEKYYLGLDNRATLADGDTIQNASSLEPTSNNYSRQSLNNNSFSFVTNTFGDYQANSPVAYFKATGGSWGPVRNLFLCTSNSSDGYLLSSVSLGSSITVLEGETITMRIAMALKNSA